MFCGRRKKKLCIIHLVGRYGFMRRRSHLCVRIWFFVKTFYLLVVVAVICMCVCMYVWNIIIHDGCVIWGHGKKYVLFADGKCTHENDYGAYTVWIVAFSWQNTPIKKHRDGKKPIELEGERYEGKNERSSEFSRPFVHL